MANSTSGGGNIQDEPGMFWCARKKEAIKANNGVLSEGHRSQLEGAPTGQMWDNFNIKKYNV